MQVHPRERSFHNVHHTMSTSVQTIRRHPKDGLYQTRCRWALHRRGKTMETYVEQYQAKYGGVTLPWTAQPGAGDGTLSNWRARRSTGRYDRLAYTVEFYAKALRGSAGKGCTGGAPGGAGPAAARHVPTGFVHRSRSLVGHHVYVEGRLLSPLHLRTYDLPLYSTSSYRTREDHDVSHS